MKTDRAESKRPRRGIWSATTKIREQIGGYIGIRGFRSTFRTWAAEVGVPQ
jgi:hypothetical protein